MMKKFKLNFWQMMINTKTKSTWAGKMLESTSKEQDN